MVRFRYNESSSIRIRVNITISVKTMDIVKAWLRQSVNFRISVSFMSGVV